MRRIAQPDHGAPLQQLRQAGRQHIDWQHRKRAVAAALAQLCRRLGRARAQGDAQCLEQGHAGDAVIEEASAVHQYGDAFACQQQRQQRHQVRLLACAVIAGDHHHLALGRRGQRLAVRMGGFEHASQLVRGFALDAVGHQDRAQLEVGYAPAQHRVKQAPGIVARQRARAVDATADLLDIAGGGKRVGWRGHGGVGRSLFWVHDSGAAPSRPSPPVVTDGRDGGEHAQAASWSAGLRCLR
ncbi:hypothetical protein D3C81_1223190 [compost metagenome]